MNIIGLDIGTTTICAIVIDSDSGVVLRTETLPNDSFIDSALSFERIQSPEIILKKCFDTVNSLSQEYAPIGCIGISGQMHGIVYLDANGNSVSPLYIWQDESGNETYENGQSYASYLTQLTGCKMASGFGGTTYFYHKTNNRIPENAVCFCTIHDYVGMKLSGRKSPLTHVSDAASLGLFKLDSLCFDETAIKKAGLDFSFFPEVTSDFAILGEFNGIPVAAAIGDNQASFLGSVNDMEHSILINIGTGGQISYLTSKPVSGVLEARPCFGSSYIAVGSSLCGGRAFALLEEFLRKSSELITGQKTKSAYPAIDRFLADNPHPDNPLNISTAFAGTRENPDERGFIKNIGLDNFTPEQLICGVLDGMVNELKEMYTEKVESHRMLIGSGNGLRKNKALQSRFSDSFCMPLKIPSHSEEAAFGAALFGMTAAKIKSSIFEAQMLISY